MQFPDLRACRVLPVITVIDVESTLQLASALQRGGMRAVEITLRSAAALDAIAELRRQMPGLLVAAGTVLGPPDVERALAAGAQLLVSPGSTDALLASAAEHAAPLLPGVATASEVMRGLDAGLSRFKLFPAEAVGGRHLLKSLAGPFPDVEFCPTGGLGPGNFRDYLALSNVICCGGSWMVDRELVQNERWSEIERLAAEAMSDA
jgi:2-dehydro-3-deoxyphosphogluconate aldolase/(4S)-4-hydroxy-2-oxoglutarate aldolase